MLNTTVLLFAAVAEPVFAEDGGGFGSRYESIPHSSAKSERADPGMSNTGNVGTRNSEMAWRDGKTGLLQSALTRAMIFSAMTNAVAFGSLWASNYPGISSMGRMMALALLCTMTAAVLFQPVLMGKPRQIKTNSPSAP